MSAREEFVRLALSSDMSISELCARYGISRKTGYKWINVYRTDGAAGLADRSRRPHHSPRRIDASLERVIMDLANEYPAWGARKLWKVLSRSSTSIPAVSTIQGVLRRHGRICEGAGKVQGPFIRFEHPRPNDLWQMDFKMDIPHRHGKAHALTVLDDHSRYNLCLQACTNQRTPTVQEALRSAFRTYGMPHRMTMDNGAPWGDSGLTKYTKLTVWLLKLGINVSHSRPYHPQTQGKDERFHRTLGAELLQRRTFHSMDHIQDEFNRWRHVYNTIRPHEGIHLATPIDRFQPSTLVYPEILPSIEYNTLDDVRKVEATSYIQWRGYRMRIGKAFIGERVAVRRTNEENIVEIYFATQHLHTFDLSQTR